MLQEFKEFIQKGNAIDMAVGFVMGAAFTAIVNSLVNDLIMPILGLLLGGIDFAKMASASNRMPRNQRNAFRPFLFFGFTSSISVEVNWVVKIRLF